MWYFDTNLCNVNRFAERHTALILPDQRTDHRFFPLLRPKQKLRHLKSGSILHLISTIKIDQSKLFKIIWTKDQEVFLTFTPGAGFEFMPLLGIPSFSEVFIHFFISSFLLIYVFRVFPASITSF